jgi:hypothetical protein
MRRNKENAIVRVRVRVRVTLRLAVYRQSVRLGYKPLEIHDQQLFLQLNTCFHSPNTASYQTRRWVCSLQLQLVPASAVILKADSRGIRDHILLLQFRDSHNLGGGGGEGNRNYVTQSKRVAGL